MRALLLVDLQNDFCKNGALEVKDGDLVIPVANSLIKKFKENDDLIIATKDWHPITHKSFASNSNGKALVCNWRYWRTCWFTSSLVA